jgi:hypothetical protein
MNNKEELEAHFLEIFPVGSEITALTRAALQGEVHRLGEEYPEIDIRACFKGGVLDVRWIPEVELLEQLRNSSFTVDVDPNKQ